MIERVLLPSVERRQMGRSFERQGAALPSHPDIKAETSGRGRGPGYGGPLIAIQLASLVLKSDAGVQVDGRAGDLQSGIKVGWPGESGNVFTLPVSVTAFSWSTVTGRSNLRIMPQVPSPHVVEG